MTTSKFLETATLDYLLRKMVDIVQDQQISQAQFEFGTGTGILFTFISS